MIARKKENGAIALSLGETLHIGYTVGNIMMSTKKDVKKITYRSTTMQSHVIFGAKETKRLDKRLLTELLRRLRRHVNLSERRFLNASPNLSSVTIR